MMEPLIVEWYESAGNCDFCMGKMELELRAALTDFKIIMVMPSIKEVHIVNPPFVLCNGCQRELNLVPGQSEIGYMEVAVAHTTILTRLVTLRNELDQRLN